jgi:hypothetical protein
MLAGMVRVRQNAGESRENAAQWIARNIPEALEQKLASKSGAKTRQIDPRVLEWFDKYSGAGGQPGLGRDAYLLVEQSTPILVGSPSLMDEYMKWLMQRLTPTLAS